MIERRENPKNVWVGGEMMHDDGRGKGLNTGGAELIVSGRSLRNKAELIIRQKVSI